MVKRYQGITRSRISKKDSQCNGQNMPKAYQKPYIKEGQSIQWPKDTKGIIRSCKSKEDSQYNGQKTPKAYPEAGISKKDSQYNDQKKKEQRNKQ